VEPLVTKDLVSRFGEENVSGLMDLIQSDWVDSCHSDVGEATQEEWDRRKIEMGGGISQEAWEVRRGLWKSRKVSARTAGPCDIFTH
jgi:hypothetical protein